MQQQRELTEASLVTIGVAVRAMRVRRSLAVAWLREHQLVRNVAGRERVIWGDVLRVIRGDGQAALRARPTFKGLPRERL
jgi:hypothetical protein